MNAVDMTIDTPAVWKGPELDWTNEGLHLLNDAELKEIDHALQHLKSLGNLDFPEITPATFPLETVGQLMRDLPAFLSKGRGFLMLRGLPREKYSDDDMARIYVGLGSYVSRPVTQSYLGDLIGHVMDVSDLEPKSRGYRKGGGQLMHTDSCDIIGLMCLRTALSGGESRISSALAVHNHLLEHRPDLLEVLREGLFLKRTDEDGRRATRTFSEFKVPFFSGEGADTICYLPTGYARLAEKSGERPYSPLESEALYQVRKIAASPEFYLDMGFKDGDIQFLNNRVMVHGRTDYQDAKALEDRRHLMRLWLTASAWPTMPDCQVFHKAEDLRLWSQYRKPFGEMPSTHNSLLLEGGVGRMVD